jgi:hypothetical protein
MDTHDTRDVGTETRLRTGMAITIEPGYAGAWRVWRGVVTVSTQVFTSTMVMMYHRSITILVCALKARCNVCVTPMLTLRTDNIVIRDNAPALVLTRALGKSIDAMQAMRATTAT